MRMVIIYKTQDRIDTMSYHIDAWIENGVPQVKITDARTGREQIRWTGRAQADDAQQLFRKLLLVGCAHRLGDIAPSAT